jgi:hypothetical protein
MLNGAMSQDSRHKLSLVLSLTGLACPLLLFGIVLLMRNDLITFHDDITGWKGLGFFMMWALALLPTGLLSSCIALFFNRRSILAICSVLLNLGLLSFILFLR